MARTAEELLDIESIIDATCQLSRLAKVVDPDLICVSNSTIQFSHSGMREGTQAHEQCLPVALTCLLSVSSPLTPFPLGTRQMGAHSSSTQSTA